MAETDIDTWCSTRDVNLKVSSLSAFSILGTNLPTRFFLTQPSFKGKTIINTSSIGALLGVPGLVSGYKAERPPSQGCLTTILSNNRFTEFLNNEHGDQGLRALPYHPGGVPTELALNTHKKLHGLLVDKPSLPVGYTVWLTRLGADFLQGLYSSHTRDIDALVAKKDETEGRFCGVAGLNACAAQ